MAKLYFYYSAMNAGKSTTLLQSNHNYREQGMQTLLFTPSVDDRYQQGVIQSRIGLRAEAVAFTPNTSLLDYVKQQMAKPLPQLKCVLIDEAQFLNRHQVWQLTEIADQLNVPVLAYGLRTDFQGELFEGSRYLLAWAEELVEIKTVCHCGAKATMNLRVDANGQAIGDGEQILIGGNESYLSMCRKHHKLSLSASRRRQTHGRDKVKL